MAFYSILRSCFLRCALLVVIVRTEEVFNTTPRSIKTNFSCFNRPMGFYADVEANCRVYHTCDDHGNKFSYRCPEETAFRQDALICDHAHLVDCQATIYPSTEPPNENIDKYIDNAHASSIRSPDGSVGSLDDRRLSFSRSFQVIQRSDNSVPNKLQSGFVFSASLFLKDQDRARDQAEQISDPSKMCNPKNRMAIPIARTLTDRFDSWRACNDKANPKGSPLSLAESRAFVRDNSRSFGQPNSSPIRPPASNINQQPPFPRERSPSFGYNSDYHPYSETLRSIQTNAHAKHETSMKPTTEIPVHALTLSLKPLVPNELEYDPYYPKQPTSTEAYYTPSNRGKLDIGARFFSSSQSTPLIARPNVPFKIPSVLPDLNTLDDLVDRRKFFYIPRQEIKSI